MKLQNYEVWQEGFQATGESSSHIKIGEAKAASFREACHIVMCQLYLESVDRYRECGEYYDPDRWDYDPQRGTWWGCRLFDNEESAMRGSE
jgi:hypothetical protein